MLSVAEVKEIMEEPEMSNEEAEQVRNACYELARLARESLLDKKRNDNNEN